MREQRTKVTRSGVYWRGRELDKGEFKQGREKMTPKEEFERWHRQTRVDTGCGHPWASDIWDYFAPHREFPREDEGRKILDDLANLGVLSSTKQVSQAASLLSDRALVLLYGECPMCSGSKQVPIQAYEKEYILEDEEGDHWKPCPDCQGEKARPEPAHPNGSNCPNPNNEGLCGCKPCPTCGGRGEAETWAITGAYPTGRLVMLPCPDCTRPQSFDEAAQRSRASAKRARCLKCGVARWESTSLCDHVFVNRRMGQQRVQTDRRGPINLQHNLEYLHRLRIRRTGDRREHP